MRLLQDQILAARARDGDRAAFDELYRRHAGACWRLALAVTRDPEAAHGAVARAFAATLATPGPAPMPRRGLLLALLRATRRAAPGTVAPPIGAPPVSAIPPSRPTVATSPALTALHALPERWRSALWLVDGERLSSLEAAYVLEQSPPAAASLVHRARLGLRERALRADLPADDLGACRRATQALSAYADGSLGEPDERRVRAHLDRCEPCRDRLASLDDLATHMRRAVAPLPPALADEASRRWSASLVRAHGPLGLRLPGGQPVPAWLERVGAGAAAAVIALGITGAILAGGRGRSRDDSVARPAASEAAFGSDGESALGGGDGLSDLVLEGDGFVAPPASTPPPAAPRGPAPAPAGGALPRGTVPAVGSGSVTLPAATLPPPPGAGGPAPTPPPVDQAPPPAPGPAATPPAQVTVGIGDAVVIGVGEACTGVSLLGTTIGCAPSTSGGPVSLSTGGGVLPPLGL